MSFEVRYSDLAGRIGKLETGHGILETPAFIPVVHPVRQTISPQFLKNLGFNGLITNAYTTLKHYGDEARTRGIHDILNYDGVIMTDSGGYQILEYGAILAKPGVISQFERDIGSDISVPLDKPTGYGLKYQKAQNHVEETLANAKATLEGRDVGGEQGNDNHKSTIWVGPVQGGEHLDLVTFCADALDKMGFPVLAIGSPVEMMAAYEFSILAQMIAAVKRTVPTKPIHLFGAGHPLTIPLAVSLGCDMFDSASYMLYAKDDRYMHTNGTLKLQDLLYLPCQCPVCCTHTLEELRQMSRVDRTVELAKHNLYVLKAEVGAVKQAIVDGRLWEYVMLKARAHPKLMKAMELFKNFEFLEDGTPLFKGKAVFLYEPIDQYRPEARRFRRIVSTFRSVVKKNLVLYPIMQVQPFYTTRDFIRLVKKFPQAQICAYNQFLGVIPVEICDIFPAAHHLSSATAATCHQAKDYPTFIESLDGFLASNTFGEITIVADDFMHDLIYNNSYKDKLNAKVLDYKEGIVFEL
ncbi:MAG TPA: tRNA guanosine(15) transglycosylase TgtA [Candidatus Nitrosopolaris sp.]|nr:tRNA guanosine(15) transglycosylase TgtA [Candidatus Nitrosopolaris sp.]